MTVVKKKRRVPWAWIVAGVVVASGGGYGYWQYQANAANAAALPKGVELKSID